MILKKYFKICQICQMEFPHHMVLWPDSITSFVQICQVANHDTNLPWNHIWKLLDWTEILGLWGEHLSAINCQVHESNLWWSEMSDVTRHPADWVLLLLRIGKATEQKLRNILSCSTVCLTLSSQREATSQRLSHHQQPPEPQNTTQDGLRLSNRLLTHIIWHYCRVFVEQMQKWSLQLLDAGCNYYSIIMILLLLRFLASLTILVRCLLSVIVSPVDLISLSDTQTCPSGTNKRVHLVHSHWNPTFFTHFDCHFELQQFLHTTFTCFELDWVVAIRSDDYVCIRQSWTDASWINPVLSQKHLKS